MGKKQAIRESLTSRGGRELSFLLISMTGGRKEASYNGALSAARRDKKAWGREGGNVLHTTFPFCSYIPFILLANFFH